MTSIPNISLPTSSPCCHDFVSSNLEKNEQNLGPIFCTHLLPLEACAKIFLHAFVNPDTSLNANGFCLMRTISRAWCSLADKTILPFCWGILTGTKLPSLQNFILQAEQKRPIDHPMKIDCSTLWNRFNLLTQSLQQKGAPIPFGNPVLGILPCQYENMQKQLDDSLITVWGKMRQKINFNGDAEPKSAQEIREWISLSANANHLLRITHLDLSNLGLTVLPPEIGKLIELKTLDLKGNKLTSLPDAIGNLSKLTMLYLQKNQLKNLPDAIGKLDQLTYLDLKSNKLAQLPDAIGHLHKLKTLDLQKNNLACIPNTIGKLSALDVLFLQDNNLISLPDGIGGLNQLTMLDLNGNQLTNLPDAIGYLKKLKGINLLGNKLASLPKTINASKVKIYGYPN
jgi:Leucine-rich repeat (LRR) protein